MIGLRAAAWPLGPASHTSAPAPPRASALDTSAINASALDAYVRRHAVRDGLPGVAVVVVRNGQIAYETGVGTGRGGAPITAETPFMISSLSKAVTGLAVMRLVEDGRLKLDAPVTRYLPDVVIGVTEAQRRQAASITVRHLLHHRSGLAVSTSFVAPPANRPGCAPCLDHVPLSAEPGTRFAYTNLNYALLGRVLEGATGESYRTVLHDEVGDPLGMQALFAQKAAAERAGLAPPHQFWFGVPVRSRGLALDTSATPAGLLAASAKDLGRVLAMIQADGVSGSVPGGRRVLKPASVDTLLAPWPRAPTGYAMGWGVGFWDGRLWDWELWGGGERIYRHGGMLGGYSAFMATVPGRDVGVVVLVNVNSAVAFPARNRLAYGVLRLATGENPGPVLPLERLARLLALALGLAALARLGVHVARWWEAGRPVQSPGQVQWTPGLAVVTVLQIAAPLALVGLPTTYYGVSPLTMLAFQPDLALAALVAGTALLADVPLVIGLTDSASQPNEESTNQLASPASRRTS